ncbi:malonate decarboxylase holo-[acyl-carrier-protein] synthase [Rhodoblastus sp.]|jgi:phosphoribosyl-dephospho-CoA transferase|uniref:malonate decarboxylase holo-[acyl-carrier-protein] synthase n=1 Tax=Rhodoblastus sp. TaxID=1962975 RepID=UPI002600C412|nr:malonate decarboxylase holo-[acyl-carrier-protein] synthase [Rhodoblastus sp.]
MRQADVYRRHDWVYLTDYWGRQLVASLSRENKDALARWMAQRRPLVVARRQEGDAPDLLRLGLALPGKKRICVAVSADAVVMRRRPPFLLEVIKIGAGFWPEAMRELVATIGCAAPDTRIFGSLAWQFFSADPAYSYVTPESDIDLLLTPSRGANLSAWIDLLQDFERRQLAPRLDGEIALPGGNFVSWREFAARPKKILVKGADNISLRPIEDIDALFSARAA